VAFRAHDAKEFPEEGELRVVAALATLCGQKDITEWGVKALVACLQRPESDPAAKAMWKKLKAFMNVDSASGEGTYLPSRIAALCEKSPSPEVCVDARDIAAGVSAESAAGVLRLRDFLWAFLGRAHLRSFADYYGDEEVLAERRYVTGLVRPQPTSQPEVAAFGKVFGSLATNASKRMVGRDVLESAKRVSGMRRDVDEDAQRVVLAALCAVGDKDVLSRLPTRDSPAPGSDVSRYTLSEEQRQVLWAVCVKKIDPQGKETRLSAHVNALASKPLDEVDPKP